MIDIKKLYQDFNIDHQSKGHKHCRPGWIQIECPFCSGNKGYHLGYCYNERDKYKGAFVCWRCGGHNLFKVIQEILDLPKSSIKEIIRKYRTADNYYPDLETNIIRKKKLKFPGGMKELQDQHDRYLIKRNFDPEKIETEYEIMGTGPIAPLEFGLGKNKKILNYKNRIIVPIKWKEKIVSFQGRDITNKHKLKYMACPEEGEVIEHKSILYGNTNGDSCVLVEGVTDVWRLGFGSLCCFGIKYRLPQIRILSKYKRVFLLFDPDQQAQIQAKKIESSLKFRGVEVELLKGFNSDPGDFGDDEAENLMRELGLC